MTALFKGGWEKVVWWFVWGFFCGLVCLFLSENEVPSVFVSDFKSDQALFCFDDIHLGFAIYEMIFILFQGYVKIGDLSLSPAPLLFPT